MSNRNYVFLSLFLLLFSCESNKKAPTQPPVDVTSFVVEPKTVPVTFDFIGFAQSSHPVEIRGRVEGFLDQIAYSEGQLVHEGELLFQLDPKQYQAQVEQAKAEVAKQEALLNNATLTVNRLTPLYEQKAASKKDLDNAVSSQQSTNASLLAAKAQLLTNEINLGYTTITSPITGYADRSQFRVGALIVPTGNSLLTTVSVLDPIWVYFTISDNEILESRSQESDKTLLMPDTGHTVTIPVVNNWEVDAILSDGSVYPYKGKVDFSSPTYDQSTGTMSIRAVFPNPDANLRPGQFMRIKVYGAKRPNALYVPQRALLQKNNGMYVYLINKDNKVVAQDVSVGDWYKNNQIITNGLKAGDQIVVNGINKLRAGMTVRVTGHWDAEDTKIIPLTPAKE